LSARFGSLAAALAYQQSAHGPMIDLVIDRREMKAVVVNALRFMGAGGATTPPPSQVPDLVMAPAAVRQHGSPKSRV
jgi:hypothetical protein